MQEKKNIRLLIVLLLLLIATGIVYWINNTSDAVNVDATMFRVEDFKSIDQVTLETGSRKIVLKFNGTRWMINDAYEADRNLIDVLFATLQQAVPKRPVAAVLRDSLSKEIQKSGVKISLLVNDQLQKVFFASGNEQKTESYFLATDKAIPYIMVIPGYRVYTSGIVELDESGWREKRIFNFNWRNFKNLTTTIPGDTKQNFKATFIDHYFGIEGVSAVDTTKLNNYLDAVSLLSAEQFVSAGYSSAYDSLVKTTPMAIIDVSDIADRHYSLAIYPQFKNGKKRIGKLGDGQIVIFQNKALEPILRGRDYF